MKWRMWKTLFIVCFLMLSPAWWSGTHQENSRQVTEQSVRSASPISSPAATVQVDLQYRHLIYEPQASDVPVPVLVQQESEDEQGRQPPPADQQQGQGGGPGRIEEDGQAAQGPEAGQEEYGWGYAWWWWIIIGGIILFFIVIFAAWGGWGGGGGPKDEGPPPAGRL